MMIKRDSSEINPTSCFYCGLKPEYFSSIENRYLCEDCRIPHLHAIQEKILEVVA